MNDENSRAKFLNVTADRSARHTRRRVPRMARHEIMHTESRQWVRTSIDEDGCRRGPARDHRFQRRRGARPQRTPSHL
jgi:hypothetical protein